MSLLPFRCTVFSLMIFAALPKSDGITLVDVQIHNYSLSRGPESMFNINESLVKIPGGYASIDLHKDWDNNNKYLCEAKQLKNGKYRKIIGFPGTGACDAFNTLIGNLWLLLEAAYGVKNPGKCPIPKGHYQSNTYMNVSVNAFKYLLKVVPHVRGMVQLTCNLYDMSGKDLAYLWGVGEGVYE